MKRIVRQRLLTKKEAAEDQSIREQIEKEFPKAMSNPNIEAADLFTPNIVVDRARRIVRITFGSKSETPQLLIGLSNDPQTMESEINAIAGKFMSGHIKHQ